MMVYFLAGLMVCLSFVAMGLAATITEGIREDWRRMSGVARVTSISLVSVSCVLAAMSLLLAYAMAFGHLGA